MRRGFAEKHLGNLERVVPTQHFIDDNVPIGMPPRQAPRFGIHQKNQILFHRQGHGPSDIRDGTGYLQLVQSRIRPKQLHREQVDAEQMPPIRAQRAQPSDASLG